MKLKQHSDALAIFGNPPAFAEKLHVGRPNIGDRERLMARLNEVLDRRWLTNAGPMVQEFEKRLAERMGVKHCIAICSGEIALEIAIRALGLKGEVIVPSFTFVATAHGLQWQEITPVFADIDPNTHLIDPRSVERLITPRTTGIIAVNLWGNACAIDELQNLADRHGLKLMFDSAHAFGCTYRGRPLGNFGSAEVFSFHATKFVNSLEGGAIATNDDDLARRIRLMKNFGFVSYDNVGFLGTNGKMNEFSAAMGLCSLEAMDSFIGINQRNHETYAAALTGIPGVRLLGPMEGEKTNYQYVIAEIDPSEAGIHRDRILDVLWAENIIARRYFYPGCHRMQPYRAYFPLAGTFLPATEQVCDRILVLPTGQQMDVESIEAVCRCLQTCVEHGATITRSLEQEAVQYRVHKDLAGGPAGGCPPA